MKTKREGTRGRRGAIARVTGGSAAAEISYIVDDGANLPPTFFLLSLFFSFLFFWRGLLVHTCSYIPSCVVRFAFGTDGNAYPPPPPALGLLVVLLLFEPGGEGGGGEVKACGVDL